MPSRLSPSIINENPDGRSFVAEFRRKQQEQQLFSEIRQIITLSVHLLIGIALLNSVAITIDPYVKEPKTKQFVAFILVLGWLTGLRCADNRRNRAGFFNNHINQRSATANNNRIALTV